MFAPTELIKSHAVLGNCRAFFFFYLFIFPALREVFVFMPRACLAGETVVRWHCHSVTVGLLNDNMGSSTDSSANGVPWTHIQKQRKDSQEAPLPEKVT